MSTATETVATDHEATETRRITVGDVVWYSHFPTTGYPSGVLETVPAVVVRVNVPSEPRPTLGLAILSLTAGYKMCQAVPYADVPTKEHYSFPDGSIPRPVFASYTLEREHGTPPIPGVVKGGVSPARVAAYSGNLTPVQ